MHSSSVEVDLTAGSVSLLNPTREPWKITMVETGATTMTGGRIRRAREYIGDETFLLTYGDGVSDIDINALIHTHRSDKSLVTLTAVQPPGRFGTLSLDSNQTKVHKFLEKPKEGGAWINGGYFVVEPSAIDFINGDDTSWEQEPLMQIADAGQLSAYKHRGFWQPMDTLRDKQYLESMWDAGSAPWKLW